MEGHSRETRKQKRTRIILIVCIIAALALLAGIIAAGIAGERRAEPAEQMESEEIIYGDEYLGIDPRVDEELADWRNVLLFGIDEAADEGGNGDAAGENSGGGLLMVSINKDTDEMKMTSIDGRTYLKIEENSSVKVSKACETEDMDGLLRCINSSLDLNIREAAALPWSMIEKLVDDIGGIEMETAEGEKCRLDGKKAVEYAVSDEGGKGVQQVLTAALKKAKTMTTEEVTPILEEIMPQAVLKNMNRDQVSALLMEMAVAETAEGVLWPYDAEESGDDGETVLIPETLESNVSRLHEELFGQ